MTRTVAGGRRRWTLVLPGAAALVLMAGTAQAQWIGSPGGGAAVTTSPAPMTAPAPAAPAPVAPTASADPSSSGFGGTMGPGSLDGPDLSGGLGGGGFAPPGARQPQPDGPSANCRADVEALKADLEKAGKTLQSAATKKVSAEQICPLFRRFVGAQQKFYDYLLKNRTQCGVPADALKQLKTNTAQTSTTRDKVCKAAEMAEKGGGGGGPPAQGQLSQGLGLPSGIPSTTNAKPGGVFDTLGGNALR